MHEHSILQKISEFASGLRLIESKISIPETDKGNGVVGVGKFLLQEIHKPIPIFSVHNLSYPNPCAPIRGYGVNAMDRQIAFFVPLPELVVVEHMVFYIFEDEEGSLVELFLLRELSFLPFLVTQFDIESSLLFIKLQLLDRMSKFTILRFHDADSPEVEPTQ